MVQGGPVTSGDALRRRVRRATVAVVWVAAVSSIGITAGLAYANATKDDPDPISPTTDTSGSGIGQSDGEDAAQAPTTQQRAAPRVVPPQQLPSSGSGRSHARSGGS